MKKRRKLKRWVKVTLLILAAILLVVVTLAIHNSIEQKNRKEESLLVEQYVTCLNNNFTQRDYCAKQIGSEYHYMDLLVEQYGYTYVQKGYDLYLVK